MKYKLDCQYMEQQRIRPYCNKLQKEIRPKNCDECGWYSLGQNIREKELGLGATVEEDIKRLEE